MRFSRETELVETYPVHVVTNWLGNTPAVAARHYLQTTDQHFQRAIGKPDEKAQRKAQQSEAELRGPASHDEKPDPVFAGEYQPVRSCTNVQATRQGLEP